MGIHVQNTAGFPLLPGQVHNLIPQVQGILGGAFQEGFITVIHGEIVTDEASQVDFVDPASFAEAAPAFVAVLIVHCYCSLIIVLGVFCSD